VGGNDMSADRDPASNADFSEFDDPFVRDFLNQRCREVSQGTVDGDVTALRQYTEILGDTSVEDAEYSDVDDFANALANGSEVTEETLKVYISTVSKLHEYLNHFESENMPDVSKLPSRYKNVRSGVDRKPIEPDEVKALIDATDSLREALLITMIYIEGLRASEAAGIKFRHLRLEDDRIEIKDSKNDKSRTLALHPDLEFMLKVWLNEERPSYVGSDSDYLFVGKESGSIDKQDVWQVVHDAAEEAGIQRIIGERADGRPVYRVKPHVLRHSFATHAFDDGEGMEVEDLSIFLGHEDTRTTKEYIHEYSEEGANNSFDEHFDPF
jgi:site-specific recombinase XerD